MTKNDMQDMLMGLAVVALGYALYAHFKPAAGSAKVTRAASVATAFDAPNYDPTFGAPYNANTPSGYMKITDLLRDAAPEPDWSNWAAQSTDPMINGNDGRDSVFLPGAKPWAY